MPQESDVIWSGRPWIKPSVVLRTISLAIVVVLASVALSMLGLLAPRLFWFPVYLWVYIILVIAWLLSLARLMVRRASSSYTLRRSSLEVVRGLVGRRTLVVSPSGFSELEVDQGIVGRMLNYGSIEVRSQGGQTLNLDLVRNPLDVSAKIRDVMTAPTVRMATDRPVAPVTRDEKT